MNAASPSAPRGLTPRQKRFAWIAAGLAVLSVAVGLVLYALSSNIVFFFTPTQIAAALHRVRSIILERERHARWVRQLIA